MRTTPDSTVAQWLNRHCYCSSADIPALQQWLATELARRGLAKPVVETHPHLFSAAPVFIAGSQATRMRDIIDAVEAMIVVPAYRDAVLGRAPAIAQIGQAARGGLLSYDFHLTDAGPQLIEINTNAGGAMLNAVLVGAQQACCIEVEQLLGDHKDAGALEAALFDVFVQEWQRAGGNKPLGRIAIVDDVPEQQYLYPEFLLFAQLFETHGVDCVITQADGLTCKNGALWHGEDRVDFVYNRLTDFYLADPAHATLRQAYTSDAAIVSPHPHAHTLYANKLNLTLLTDESALKAMGIEDALIRRLLEGIPRTIQVNPGSAEDWWDTRKRWFFKPATGYGSRGSYRGDKLTRRVFADILNDGYVAQELVAPSERWLGSETDPRALKLDLRCYVYAGTVLAVAARLYQGQTTNMRTPGGGFSPVYVLPEAG